MRRMTKTWAVVAALGIGCLALPAQAQESRPDSARIADLERKFEAVTRELERLQLGRAVVTADSAVSGFGPAASSGRCASL